MTFGIEVIPPLRAALQVTGKPCHNGVMPEYALCIVGHEVVFSFNLYKLDLLAQYLQCIEELYALSYGHIGVDGTVQEQQRSVDLIGIEE